MTERQAGVGRRRVIGFALMATCVLLATPTGASAVGRAQRAHGGVNAPAKPYFDSRVRARRAATGPVGSRSERSARSRMESRLGSQAVVQVDALTGTSRAVQKLNGTLTGPASGDRSAVALDWIRSNRTALGLTAADIGTLDLADRTTTASSGITHLRYRQSYRGIPTFDNGVRVNLDRDGRIINVTGSPVSDVSVPSIAPALDAAAAMKALQRNVGVTRAIDVTAGPSGARAVTHFSRGDFARLVLFDGADGLRLAWHLTYKATSLAYYDAVVDATTGAVLFRQNLTKFDADQTVFKDYPGAEEAPGLKGTNNAPLPINFEDQGWLTNATTLSGPNAHVWSDFTDNDAVDPGEEITRANGNANFTDTFNEFGPPTGWFNACDFTRSFEPDWPDPLATKARCSWNPNSPNSWTMNRQQNGVQAFYFANVFHDHLANDFIDFKADDHNFEGDDPVLVNTDDGADTTPAHGPDDAHLNNANMSTPPDHASPTMQMYLFQYDHLTDDNDPTNDGFFTFRNINGGDDAGTVWHEYTHGLSGRLVVHDDGTGAVSSPHAGAMGEAWSDWYALDLLHRSQLEFDTADPGDVDVGMYTDAVFASTRFEPIDCQPGVDDPHCPGGIDTGPGGYTFGDFGHVAGTPEVHSDGEIWMQTLWDLRRALVQDLGEDDGSNLAEQIVTEGMRLSPPEPSFLDERNAILAAVNTIAPTRRNQVWTVFANRGMGFFAGAADSSDTSPIEDFNTPPVSNARGTVAGTVTSADTGLPLGSVKVGFGGLTTNPAFPDFVAPTTSAANGRYSLTAPAGTYGGLVYDRPGWDRVTARSLKVTAGATKTSNVALRRDWSSARGGGAVTLTSDDTGAPFGCGVDNIIDQAQGVGWSAFNPTSGDDENPHAGPPTATIKLPQTIDITAFGMDPSNTCGDDISAQTKDFQVFTSPDGVHFALAKQGSFTAANNARLNIVAPTANSRGVRYIRLRLLSPLSAQGDDSGVDFIDFSEFEVFGGPRNVLPSGTLAASPTSVRPGQVVTFRAAFHDPDSRITGYTWDFDGNGTVDRTTTAASTTFAYTRAGMFTAAVGAKDFRGGSGVARRTIAVTSVTSLHKPRLPKSGRKGRLSFRAVCDLQCRVTAKLKVSKSVRKKLHLKSRTVGKLTRTFGPGTKRLTIKLSSKTKRAMRRRHVRTIKATLSVTILYSDGRRTSAHRSVKIKR
jgi:hypothetical protein